MNHKFISRVDGSTIYYSAEGARIFKITKAASDYRYAGKISAKDQEAEEEEVLLKAEKNRSRQREIDDFQDDSKSMKKKSAKTVKLTAQDIADLAKIKNAFSDQDDDDDDDDMEGDDMEDQKGKAELPKKAAVKKVTGNGKA